MIQRAYVDPFAKYRRALSRFALVVVDERYDGQAYVGLSSTGGICRLTGPARNPKL